MRRAYRGLPAKTSRFPPELPAPSTENGRRADTGFKAACPLTTAHLGTAVPSPHRQHRFRNDERPMTWRIKCLLEIKFQTFSINRIHLLPHLEIFFCHTSPFLNFFLLYIANIIAIIIQYLRIFLDIALHQTLFHIGLLSPLDIDNGYTFANVQKGCLNTRAIRKK
ncbi:Hypothetical protein PYTT_0202 [Akkermansia glycaniphila]|uniref:Uncharacterized protein n=1 Tax=Akkermansia glycaniphila TaxID=1679444 RepID=A0A1H6KIY4_9BACT|nr:Hypothetical protein PYTT_0202 [Akkermansia glycaniphila]